MRKALKAVAVVAVVVWAARRLRESTATAELVSVGYTDRSSTILDVGSPERELLLATAADAL